MDFETARTIYDQIKTNELKELKQDLIKSAVRYARTRTDWQLAEREKRGEMEQNRTFGHNAFIDSCNILSRNMAKRDEDASWREMLGDDRKEIGDFACYVHCMLGLMAR